MSASQCIKCESLVGGYEKYCINCIQKYGVKQDKDWHRTHHFVDWETGRRLEFEKDIAAISTFHVSKNVQPETAKALTEMMVHVAEMQTSPRPKQRKRHKRRNA